MHGIFLRCLQKISKQNRLHTASACHWIGCLLKNVRFSSSATLDSSDSEGWQVRCLGSVLCVGTMWTMTTGAVLPSLSWDRASLPGLGTAGATSCVRSHLAKECCTSESLLQCSHLLQPQWTCYAELAGFAVLLCFYQILYLHLCKQFPRFFIQYQPVEFFVCVELFFPTVIMILNL